MKAKYILLLAVPLLFFTGFISGNLNGTAYEKEGEILGLNHVCIRVSDFDEASDFYENTMGFPMTYRFNDVKGELLFAYFQINRSTFIELMQADDEHPEGIDHFGLETHHNEAVVSDLHSMGVRCTESVVSPLTRVNIAHAKDLNGVYFELIEAVEGSDLRRAMDDWED